VPVLVLALGTLPLASAAPSLGVLLLVPLACAVWVLRARVVASTSGLEVCNGLAARAVPWQDVDGFGVPRHGPVRLLRAGARPLLLTALPRRQLAQLRTAAEQLGRPRD
jgi:hypothetical protein